jgi:hypothetical protein
LFPTLYPKPPFLNGFKSNKNQRQPERKANMKIGKLQLAIMAIALAALTITPNLFAYVGLDGTLYFTNSTFQNGVGGEFNAVTTGLGSFATFCIEDGENIAQPPSGPYTYTINTGAVQGGPGADAIDPNTGLAMDNVSIGTAWLYSQFQAGTLTLDNGTGSYFDADELANAGELQNAIWYLEDEAPGQSNGYVILAETALNETLPQIEADSNGAYGVVALNLFNPDGSLAQDQLAVDPEFVPVPEPTTAGCFLLGLGSLAGWRRFRNKKFNKS